MWVIFGSSGHPDDPGVAVAFDHRGEVVGMAHDIAALHDMLCDIGTCSGTFELHPRGCVLDVPLCPWPAVEAAGELGPNWPPEGDPHDISRRYRLRREAHKGV